MKAMVIEKIADIASNEVPLRVVEKPIPEPGKGEILIEVSACAVCHTELDEIEGRTPPPRLPVVPGHQVVGRVKKLGHGAKMWCSGDRVGVAWIFSSCGKCRYCLSGEENLCADFKATGRDVDGGYAEYMTVREDFVYSIPELFSDIEAAPLLCAGAIGYRSLGLTGIKDGETLGLTGFGASGHLVLMMARKRYPSSRVFVFARSEMERTFALELGATWAGNILDDPPTKCAAIIDTTPVWRPVLASLRNLEPGGRLVINAIRKEDEDKSALLELDYAKHLWLEKEIKTVANVARSDVREFLDLAASVPIKPEVEIYDFTDANKALLDLKNRHIRGAKVLRVPKSEARDL